MYSEKRCHYYYDSTQYLNGLQRPQSFQQNLSPVGQAVQNALQHKGTNYVSDFVETGARNVTGLRRNIMAEAKLGFLLLGY